MPATTAQNDIYFRRINTGIGYIRQNLDGDLSFNALSRAGCFSKFHFHRVFKSIPEEAGTGLGVAMRLEPAATFRRTVPKLCFTAGAVDVGFSCVAVFSRAFRKHFGVRAGPSDRKST